MLRLSGTGSSTRILRCSLSAKNTQTEEGPCFCSGFLFRTEGRAAGRRRVLSPESREEPFFRLKTALEAFELAQKVKEQGHSVSLICGT